MRKLFVAVGILGTVMFGTGTPVQAHSGGLDAGGGHYCRAAGLKSGKCQPLNSYHCHKPACKPKR